MRGMRITLVTTLMVAATAASAQAPRLTALPSRPQPGAIVRLSLRAAKDSISSVRGTLAGEPLHFIRTDSGWHAIGGVPTDAQGNLVARAFVHLASGKVDTVRATMVLPPIPKPKAVPLSVDSSFSKPMDQETEARVARENAAAREIGRKSHDSPPMWTAGFLRPRS